MKLTKNEKIYLREVQAKINQLSSQQEQIFKKCIEQLKITDKTEEEIIFDFVYNEFNMLKNVKRSNLNDSAKRNK